MAPPTAMLLNEAADITGSTLAVILIPLAGSISLVAWLALVFYADRDHLHGPDVTRRPAAKTPGTAALAARRHADACPADQGAWRRQRPAVATPPDG